MAEFLLVVFAYLLVGFCYSFVAIYLFCKKTPPDARQERFWWLWDIFLITFTWPWIMRELQFKR